MVILNQGADNEDLCTPLKESHDKACIRTNTMQQWVDGLEGTLETGRFKAIMSPRGTIMQIRKRYILSKYFIYWKIFILLILL